MTRKGIGSTELDKVIDTVAHQELLQNYFEVATLAFTSGGRRALELPAPRTTAALMMASKSERHPTELAALFGKRAVIAQETNKGERFNESLVKALTGGDAISARRMREDFWEFEPTHKLWLATNHKPIIKGTNYAIWRRIRLIPFDVAFTEDSHPVKDPDIEDKLTAELPGILAWAIRGCLDWQRAGLGMAEAVKTATASYQVEMDVLAAWLEECCVTDPNAKARASDLYTSYTGWCAQNGERVETQRNFGMRLTERGFERKLSNSIHWWFGMGLISTHSTHSTLKSILTGASKNTREQPGNQGTKGTKGTECAEPPADDDDGELPDSAFVDVDDLEIQS